MRAAFTLPSQLGRRMSVVDPLGFRGVATHFLHRVAPGFTGRVRGRGWLPVLCWAAEVVAAQESQRDLGDDPRATVRVRRDALMYLERAIRMGAIHEGDREDNWRWRYGNRERWWELHRDRSWSYWKRDQPPFFASRSSELANNALGCLRRTLERYAFLIPSEGRLRGASVDVLPTERYAPTDRGRALAQAYEEDLRAQEISVTALKEWGLFPDRLAKRKRRDAHARGKALSAIARALPMEDDGTFALDRFPKTAAALDDLLQVERDPLFGTTDGGPVPAVVRAVKLTAREELHIHDALVRASDSDPWGHRLACAARAGSTLMGRASDSHRPFLQIIGDVFVRGMRSAFPDEALDCPRFLDDFAGFQPDGSSKEFGPARDAYRRAWDELEAAEAAEEVHSLPAVESNKGSAIEHFNEWLRDAEDLDLEKVLELHLELPRFRSSRVLPLVEVDGGGAYLETAFPWSQVETPVAREEQAHDAEVSDEAELVAASDDLEAGPSDTDDSGRYIITDYWYAASVARKVILGGER